MARDSGSFWKSAAGVVTALAGVLSAVAALIGALYAAGVIGGTHSGETHSGSSVLSEKRAVIKHIATATSHALNDGSFVANLAAGASGAHVKAAYRPVMRAWDAQASSIDGDLTAYFGDRGHIRRDWADYEDAVRKFVELSIIRAPRARRGHVMALKRYLGPLETTDRGRAVFQSQFVANPDYL